MSVQSARRLYFEDSKALKKSDLETILRQGHLQLYLLVEARWNPVNGQYVSKRIRIDIRDVKKSGFLLTHTSLPYILRENLAQLEQSSQIEIEKFHDEFSDAFLTWFGSGEHDFLRAYICSINVASTFEENPLDELEKLREVQSALQGQGDAPSSTLSPPYCSPPRWAFPTPLGYHVLLHDASTGAEDRYGLQFCHLLRINSAPQPSEAGMPDPWARILRQRYRGFNHGLQAARQALAERTKSLHQLLADSGTKEDGEARSAPASTPLLDGHQQQMTASVNPDQSVSSLFTTSSVLMPPHGALALSNGAQEVLSPQLSTMEVANLCRETASSEGIPVNRRHLLEGVSDHLGLPLSPLQAAYSESEVHGQWLDPADRERLRDFVAEFVRTALVPYVEKQMAAQNDVLANRKGLGKSINSVRKWLGATTNTISPSSVSSTLGIASSTAANGTAATGISYSSEGSEQQTRRLADIAIQFGLHNFAHQLYQSLKKDFANDQAWLHHAAALEMAAVSHFLNNPFTQGSTTTESTDAARKQAQKAYPQRYAENAINYYTGTCMQPILALRCALLNADILTALGLPSDAASQLLRVSGPAISDLYNAVLYGHAAQLFEKAKRFRRTAFYSLLAGHRFVRAGLKTLAHHHYRKAYHLLKDKGWSLAEAHILLTVASDSTLPSVGVPSLEHLKCSLEPGQQSRLLAYYGECQRSCEGQSPPLLTVPLVDAQRVVVYYGMDAFASYEASRPLSSVRDSLPTASEGGGGGANDPWTPPRNIWTYLEGAPSQLDPKLPRPCVPFSDEGTENKELVHAPPFEPITFVFLLNNPTMLPLDLENISLNLNEVRFHGRSPTENGFQSVQCIPSITVPPSFGCTESAKGADASNAQVVAEIAVIPTNLVSYFAVDQLKLRLRTGEEGGVEGCIPLTGIAGKRLYATKEQRMSKARAQDNRLRVRVEPVNYPRLNVTISSYGSAVPIPPNYHLSSYCDQLHHFEVGIDNAGSQPVDALYLCTDKWELVTLSQPEGAKSGVWLPCSQRIVESRNGDGTKTAVYSIHRGVGVSTGQQLRLHMLIRAPSRSVQAMPIHLLFYYSSAGRARQFRCRFLFSAEPLLDMGLQTLSRELCALQLHIPPCHHSIYVRVEVLRIALVINVLDNRTRHFVGLSDEGSDAPSIALCPILNRRVLLESGQRLNFCFRCALASASPSFGGEIWLVEKPSEMPTHFHPVAPSDFEASDTQSRIAHLRVAVLWRANLTDSEQGKVITLFGETLMPNPLLADVTARRGKLQGVDGWEFVLTTGEVEDREMKKRELAQSHSVPRVFPLPWGQT